MNDCGLPHTSQSFDVKKKKKSVLEKMIDCSFTWENHPQ